MKVEVFVFFSFSTLLISFTTLRKDFLFVMHNSCLTQFIKKNTTTTQQTQKRIEIKFYVEFLNS